MNLNSLLHLPKYETGGNIVNGSWAGIVARALADAEMKLEKIQPHQTDKLIDTIHVTYGGKVVILELNGRKSWCAADVVKAVKTKAKMLK